jgi:nitric oxide reductase NorE protein
MPESLGATATPGALPGRPPAGGRRLVGDSGLWVFVTADTFAFGLFFLIFTLGRYAQPELYRESAGHLNAAVGALNTIILLTSGWLMVLSVEAAKQGARPLLRKRLTLTMLVALGFAVTKIWEYSTKIQAGITLLTDEFFMYYFVFTGVHFLHYLIGMVALMVTLSKAGSDVLDERYQHWIESVAAYWHMVDLLWIVLFPLLYLLR